MCTTNFGRINGRLVRKASAGVKKKKNNYAYSVGM